MTAAQAITCTTRREASLVSQTGNPVNYRGLGVHFFTVIGGAVIGEMTVRQIINLVII